MAYHEAMKSDAIHDGTGEDLAIFCAGIRFWGVPYGSRSVPRGLRLAGFEGRIVYWPWHERWSGRRGQLSLPALWDVALQKKHAERIARRIVRYRRRFPDAKIHLLACSAGGGVAVRILETLADLPCENADHKPWLNSTALMSVAISPNHDMTLAAQASHVVLNYHSPLDCLILGLGTSLFGTADRKHTPAAGMLGLRQTPLPPNVKNIRWSPAMIPTGRLGGHNSAIKARFIAQYVAPDMGITPSRDNAK